MKLSELTTGDSGIIIKVRGRGAFRKRITEMGFVKWKTVKVVKNAPLKDPIQYSIMGYEISLRRAEAELIEVVSREDVQQMEEKSFNGIIDDESLKTSAREKSKVINVALVGNPNCGKTTLFNFASNSKERVGNYSGVTVDAKEAKFKIHDHLFNIADLPGTYSLTAYTPEELYVRHYITGTMPDVVINVLDASNLERNLYLTTQLIDMDIKVVIALNMYDELEKKGDKFDIRSLGKMIGIPIVPTVSSKGKGISELFRKVIQVHEDKDPTVRHIHINYGETVEKAIKEIQSEINQANNFSLIHRYSPRFLAIKMLEKDEDSQKVLSACSNFQNIEKTTNKHINRIENEFQEDSETYITDSKYGFIAGALKETYKESGDHKKRSTDYIDFFLTHKYLGIPVFLFFMWMMFQSTFSLGSYPMDWIDMGVGFIGELIGTYMPEGMFKDLLIDGIIGGVGGVIIFLPNIVILFFFISLMEDTGYMARVAFIMDRVMHKVGLHGRSFIPLLMGFGCNVPAMMATRTIENPNNRLLTILINPFMSCSARLPVYVLIIAAFFPKNGSLILFSIYGLGVLLAGIMAVIFKKVFFRKEEIPFVMELPPYRMPTLRSIIKHMWSKAAQYLKKMGGVILVASIIIWALGYFPREVDYSIDYEAQKEQLLASAESGTINFTDAQLNEQLHEIDLQKKGEHQEKSYIGRIGHFVEPAIRPLGFDWKIGVSLVTGVAAKEIVISTMGVLYHADAEAEEGNESLITKLQQQKHLKGDKKDKVVFEPLVAISFLVFILIYFPCVAVVAAIKKESGSWKWALFVVGYTTGLAWLMSFAVYQIGSLFV